MSVAAGHVFLDTEAAAQRASKATGHVWRADNIIIYSSQGT